VHYGDDMTPEQPVGLWPWEMAQLSEAERDWAIGWVTGVAEMLSKGPPDETVEKFNQQVKTIMDIGLEPGAYAYQKAREWKKRLMEVMSK
jgi:hypothetical protein